MINCLVYKMVRKSKECRFQVSGSKWMSLNGLFCLANSPKVKIITANSHIGPSKCLAFMLHKWPEWLGVNDWKSVSHLHNYCCARCQAKSRIWTLVRSRDYQCVVSVADLIVQLLHGRNPPLNAHTRTHHTQLQFLVTLQYNSYHLLPWCCSYERSGSSCRER